MAGGGKTATSSSSVQIPPEVLARYNSVNAQAQTAANQPFQQYSTNPSAFVAPLNSTQQAAIANTNAYSGAAQPYYGAASQALGAGVNAAAPLVGQSAGTIGQAQDIGNAYNQAAAYGYAGAPGAADPYNQAAGASYSAGLAAGMPMNAMSAQNVGQAQQQGSMANMAAMGQYGQAQQAVSPYNQAAGASYGAGLAAGMPMNAMSAQNVGQAQQQGSMANMAAMGQYGQAQQAVSPYNQAAGSAYGAGIEAANPYTYGGGQAVNAQQIGGQQIGQFMSPFLGSAYNAMLAGENMQNAQQASGLQGNSIQAGAFGGDRAGIAQANLAYQQNLANAQTNANFLNTGYNQALTAAQQQQGVNLSAQQANRTALQTTGQNLYNQYTGTGQALSNLGQNIFGQGTTVAQGIGNLGQQQYAQGMGAAAQQAALGNQAYNQYTGTGQALSNLGQNVFGQGTTVAQGVGALGQQQYAQGIGAAAQQAALGNQAYNQYTGTGQALVGLGQNVYGQQTGAAQGLAGVGNQAFTQGATTAAQQAALGNQVYGMGTGAAQTLGALGTGAQGAALQGAQAQMAAGTQAQQTQQAGLSALYNQFLQQQAYPFQTSQFLANIAEGTGALSGSTTTTTQPMGLLAARGGSIRGGYNSGGLVPSSMGGAVGEEHAGERFSGGGMPQVGSYGKGSAGGGYGQQGGYNPFAGINFGGLGQYGQTSAPPMQMGNVGADTTFGTIDRAPAVTPWVAPATPAAGLGATQGGVWQMPTEFGGNQGGDAHAGSGPSSSIEQGYGTGNPNTMATGGRIHKLGGGSIDPDYLAAMQKYQSPVPGGLNSLYGGKPGSTPGASSYVPAGNQPVARLMTAQAPMRQIPTPGSDLRTAAADVNALRGMYGAGKAGLFGTPGVAAQGNTPAQQPTQGLAQWLGLSSDNTMPAARGGLIGHFADGGEVPDALAIPNDQPNIRGLQAAQTPGQGSSTLGGLRGLAGDIGAVKTLGSAGAGLLGLVGLARGGVADRHGYADDGGGDDATTDDGGGGDDATTDDHTFTPRSLDDIISQGNAAYDASHPSAPQTANTVAPRSIRNNNPGNIKNSEFASSQPGYVGSDGTFAIFEKPEHGTQAMQTLLSSYAGRGLNTPASIISRWAPPEDNGANVTNQYINNVASALGVAPNDKIDVSDPNVMSVLTNAISRQESGPQAAASVGAGYMSGAPTPGLNAGQMPTASADASPLNQAASAAAIRLASGLGATQQQQPQQEPDWLQRNQSWMAPLLMGLQGARGARGVAGALIGAGAGAAQGYESVQQQLAQRQLQAAQTGTAQMQGQQAGANAVEALGRASLTPADLALKTAQIGQIGAQTAETWATLGPKVNQLMAQGKLTNAEADRLQTMTPIDASRELAQRGLIVAQTGQTGAQTANIIAMTPAQVQDAYAKGRLTSAEAQKITNGFYTPYMQPNGDLWLYDANTRTYFKAGSPMQAETTGANPAAPAPGGQPTTTAPAQTAPAQPHPWQPITTTEDAIREARRNGLSLGATMSPVIVGPGVPQERVNAVIASAQQAFNDQNTKAAAASTQILKLKTMTDQFNNLPESGFLKPGPLSESRMALAQKLNDAVTALGGKPIWPNAQTAAAEAVKKDSFSLGASATAALGSNEAARVLENAISNNPGLRNTKQGYKLISSSMEQIAQREIDFRDFMLDMKNKQYSLDGASAIFNAANPPEKYAHQAILRTVSPADAQVLRNNVQHLQSEHPDADPSGLNAYKAIESRYGKGTAKLILEGA